MNLEPYVAMHTGIVEIHHAIRGSLESVLSAQSLETRAPQAFAAGSFLLGHHHAESNILFPGLRRLGHLRSTDAAFLDACDREHHALHALCERLVGNASSAHPSKSELEALAREALAVFSSHVLDEEVGLAPARLREMIGLEGLAEIGREIEAMRQSRS